jgi:hypothetical protein
MEAVQHAKQEKLLVQLTQQEVFERGKRLAELHQSLDEHVAHEADVKEELKRAKARIEREMRECAEAVRTGHELRTVAVIEEPDYRTGIVTERRGDTHEVVRRRPIRDEERQLRLVGE